MTSLVSRADCLAAADIDAFVRGHDVGTWRDRIFIAMELVAGQTLSEWLTTERRSWRHIVSVFLSAGHGLAAALLQVQTATPQGSIAIDVARVPVVGTSYIFTAWLRSGPRRSTSIAMISATRASRSLSTIPAEPSTWTAVASPARNRFPPRCRRLHRRPADRIATAAD